MSNRINVKWVILKDSFRWLYSCDKSSLIHRSVHSQCHVVSLKCTEQNVNNQTLTQVSQLYIHVFFCLKVIRSWLNINTGGHGHVICMCVYYVQMENKNLLSCECDISLSNMLSFRVDLLIYDTNVTQILPAKPLHHHVLVLIHLIIFLTWGFATQQVYIFLCY